MLHISDENIKKKISTRLGYVEPHVAFSLALWLLSSFKSIRLDYYCRRFIGGKCSLVGLMRTNRAILITNRCGEFSNAYCVLLPRSVYKWELFVMKFHFNFERIS